MATHTPHTSSQNALSESHKGLFATLAAFFIWAGLSLYWKLLSEVSAHEILCHRIIWSFVFIFAYLLITGQLAATLKQFQNKKIIAQLTLSCIVLSFNWFLFIWAITHDRVIETSLGYYINPLLNILVGIVFLKEKKNSAIITAIVLATIGVLFQVIALGSVPLVALGLGISFCIYGVIRKLISIEAAPGLFIETSLSTPFALAYILYLWQHGEGSFLFTSAAIDGLLMFGGVLTSLPLLLFTYGARRITLTTLGIMQYIAPTFTFLFGIFIFKEEFSFVHLVTFVFIWTALAVYTINSLRQARATEILRKRNSA